jgi:hypothetical protein
MWFRVEFNKDGSVGSCKEVEGSFGSRGSVIYVDAESRPRAIKLATSYLLRLQRRRERDRKFRSEAATVGFCITCRRLPRITGKLYCEKHLAHQRANEKRYYERRKAGLVQADKWTVLERAERARRMQTASGRRQHQKSPARHLVRLLAKLDELGPERFRAYLSERIRRIEARYAIHSEAAE